MRRLKNPTNVTDRLLMQELGMAKNLYRNGLQVLRLLISDPKTKFTQSARIESPTAICYDESMLYLSGFKHVKLLWGCKGDPSDLYKLPQECPVFRDTICIGRNFSKTPLPRRDFRPSFFALTRNNRLLRFDNFTGEKLDDIYLGSVYKFTAMNWEVHGERIVLHTQYFQKNGQRCKSILQAVCLFDVFPLKFVALFELQTQFVGECVKAANVSEGLLLLSPRNRVQLYDLYELLKEENRICSCNLYETSSCCDHGPVGVFPHGLPVNFKSCPLSELLFDMKCNSKSLEFGGFPYQCIYQPLNKKGEICLQDILSGQIVARLQLENFIENDSCFFHWDDSGRIIHQKSESVHVYKVLKDEQTERFKLQLQFQMRCSVLDEPTSEPSRQMLFFKQTDEVFKLDYENEVEYLIILGVEETQSDANLGVIKLYDNETGKFVKRINLDISLKSWLDYSLIMDIDRMIIIEERPKKNVAHIYKLDRSQTG